jgi:glycosyltransferase involved in cell wall biosynthesis
MAGFDDIYINGRFLRQGGGGVQRFAREIVRGLDKAIPSNAWAAAKRWTLLAPRGPCQDIDLDVIRLRKTGLFDGHPWEQTSLLLASARGALVDLGNAGPIFHPRHLVTLHDATVFRFPENFGRRYGQFHRGLGRALATRARLCTVSEFSRGELSTVLGVPSDRIAVVPNSAEHMGAGLDSKDVLPRLGLDGRRFFLFVGSPSRNKNLPAAIEAYRRLGRDDVKLVLVGASNAAVFGDTGLPTTEGVIVAGRLSDAEVATLYRSAVALVFPSLYEGFGIPPLEAMSNDCPVIASDIPSVREVCGDAAEYFSPSDPAALAAIMLDRLEGDRQRDLWLEKGRARAARFNWRISAGRILDVLREMESAA